MEATVEVLTAEVRTLMVGARQITLSVYRQLDEVAMRDVEVFGRVNVPPGLVGRDRRTGALVSCHFEGASFPRRSDYPLGAEAEYQAHRAQYDADKAAHDALPLIVLAGLR